MAKSYYSTVLKHTADDVWTVIREFDAYAWAVAESDTVIEDGKRGDQVSAVRHVTMGERVIRQRLLAHSDVERSYAYAFADRVPFPVRDYVATIRVTPVIETGEAFVEWSATFDCLDAAETDKWTRYFAQEGFAKWLAALRGFMARERKAA
jgi:Polyketide cyclase / dehydrase and lipid transport